ncbi:unnamed protein product [Lactuca saligna]|uniref:Uncharacterized protein n=1 Tax=Lactuca saligna TaxID=75948 RepID=A0AA35Y5E6_LACSI|nr:unnamed protein product [Lactuca saligna]
MGFGSLLGMKMIDIPLKILYYVLDHFNFETLEVEFENCQVSVHCKSTQEMLGLPFGGSLLSNMDYISENTEQSYMFEWKKQYENIDKLRLKQLKNELVQSSVVDDNFIINFLVLFINTFCESTSICKCYLNPLYLIRIYDDLSSIDWCDYIVDCFVSTKKVYNPEKESSFFYGPTTYLMGDGSSPHEGNIGKNHVDCKVDDVGKNNDLLSQKDDEDDEQGNGSGCNKEEAMNLNSVVENVTKSVGLKDSQEGVSFTQFICDLVVESILKTLDQGTDGCINQKQVEDDVNENLTGFDDGTINLGEDDHKKKVILDHNVDKVIVAKKDGEENVEDCSNKNKDSNETRSLKNEIVPSFSLGFSQDSECSKKSFQSQIFSEWMTKKKIKDRVYFGKPSAGPECLIPNVDVIDASPASFAPPLCTLEGPLKHVFGKTKYINEEARSVVVTP